MSEDLKRPLLFDVHRVKNAPIALVNRQESKKFKQRHSERNEYDDAETRAAEIPTSALPLIRSPRPEKPVYVPSPSKTPSYFRWKAKPLTGNNAVNGVGQRPSAPNPSRSGPRAPSPRLSVVLLEKRPSGPPLPLPARDLLQIGPSLFGTGRDQDDMHEMPRAFTPHSPPTSIPVTPDVSSRRGSATIKESDLFQYGELPSTPVTPVTPSVAQEIPQSLIPDVTGPLKEEPADAGKIPTLPQSPAVSQLPTTVLPIMTPSPSHASVHSTTTTSTEHKRPPTPKLLDSSDQEEVGPDEDEPVSRGDDDDEPARVAIEFSGSGGGSGGSRQPQEKAIAQHVLRGKFLRKYLHANNLTRKLKETEQALRSAALHGGIPTMKGGGSLFSRSFISKAVAASATPNANVNTNLNSTAAVLGEEAAEMLNEQLPLLRRLSSIDKAINKTAKRIRRLSGIEDPGATAANPKVQRQPTLGSKSTEKPPRGKFSPLKAIGEKQSTSFSGIKEDEEVDTFEAFDDDDDLDSINGAGPGGKIDPTSAHMMRICQHVIAKRAIKSFLRQELSVITIIEVALRDDTHLMPLWLQASGNPSFAVQQQLQSCRSPTPDTSTDAASSTGQEAHRVPIKAMRADIQEAVSGYLKEGDQHYCFEEIFTQAVQAEQNKLWKRAILLASVCVALDREFLQGVLLRARCCRRIGLWTQAIKDLSHAILLRADEYKLVLLRACLYVKMNDLENALVDVNRALAFFPKCIDALLLRAEIFHRQNSIGASLQDLTTALLYDPGCWRAYYDRATIRVRAIEGDDSSLNYHWEHMKYEKLLASIIEDYVSAVRKGCQMVEVVETIGDLSVRLLEFTGDNNVLRQVVNNLTHLLQILAHDHRHSFHSGASTNARSPSIVSATAAVAVAAAVGSSGSTASLAQAAAASGGLESQRNSELTRELLIASIHSQRGRLFVLLQDRVAALADFDQAVVTEYHYPVAHFYRGAFATLCSKADDSHALATNLQHLNRCISLDPTVAGAYTVRGALYLRDLKFNSALQDFKAAVATDPTLYEVWLQIALIYLNHYHDSEECIKACSSALANDSCLARALYLRAEAYTRQGNIRAALRDYGRLTIAQPDDRWAQLMRGRLLLQMKLARPALYAFIQFMELGTYAHEQRNGGQGSSEKRAHLLCGRAYKILTRFQKAVDQFQRAVSLNPTSENLVLLSESLHSMGDTENSLRVSERVINADPNSYKGYVRRAQLLVTIGQFVKAMAEYNVALSLAPKEARVYYERGIVQMQLYLRWRGAYQLNFDDKHTQGRTLHHQKPRSPFEPRIAAIEVEATLGTDQINDEKTVMQNMKATYAGAIADFCKSIRLDPLLSEPYIDRAELYLLGEDYDRAFHDFNAAIERNPKSARAFVNLGVLKCHFSAFAAAIADFDQAIRYDSKLALAFFNRGVCYQKLQLWRHADKSYSSCIELCGVGRDIDAHRNRAIARCHTGTAFEDALKDFDEVRQSAPDDDQLHGGLGYVLLQLGRYEDAARCFATYGRLNRDTFADSGNAYFNLANSGGSARPAATASGAQVPAQTATSSYLDQKKYDGYLQKALRFYLRAARLHPSNLDLRLNMANCLRRMNEPWRAISQCDAIYKAKPLHHASLESKALCYYQMHRLPEAIDWMNAAIRSCVSSSSALENIFYAFAHKSIHRHALERKTVGEKAEARSRANERVEPTTMAQAMNAQLQELRAKRLVTSEDEDGVMSVPPPKPVNPTAEGVVLTGSHKQLLSLYMMNRGILYEKMGSWDDATRDYRDAVHFDPLAVQPLLCTATLLLLQRRYDDSRAAFEKALALEPKNGLAHLNLGVVFICKDELERALHHCNEAIRELPTCSYAYANKAVVLAKKGELKLAEQELKRAIEELPSRQEYYLARGKIISQQKRLQDAMVDFSTALFLGYSGKL